MLLDHLVEHAIVVTLDDGAVARRSTAILIDEAADARVVLRRDDQLLLHAVRHGLIALVTDACGILHGVWCHRSDATLRVHVAAEELE